MISRLMRLAALLLLPFAVVACGDTADGSLSLLEQARRIYRGPGSGGATQGVTVMTPTTGAFVGSSLPNPVIGPAGGTIEITDPSDPLAGAKIVVPSGLFGANVTFSITSAPVTSVTGLPSGTGVRGRMIRVSATDTAGDPVGAVEGLVTITLPYDPTTDYVNYYRLESSGQLEATGFDSVDTTARTVTFRTREPGGTPAPVTITEKIRKTVVGDAVYAAYVAIGVTQQTFTQLLNTERSVDSGFRPSANGWSIPNYGSYYDFSRGGNCFGMVGFAQYYYRNGFSPGLVNNYRDAQPTDAWSDDAVAIELASRVHNQMSAIWNTYTSEEHVFSNLSATDVARSIVGAIYVTRAPALIYILQVVGGASSGAHAISFYRADLKADGSITFHVYDPNKKGNDTVRVTWAPATGFANYLSGTDAGSSAYSYNFFRHVGYSVGVTQAQLAADKAAADGGFSASVFPKVTITAITGVTNYDNVMNHTGTTPAPISLPMYITADSAVKIEGTVLGGNAQVAGQVVNALWVFTPNGNQTVNVNNSAGSGDGKFSVVVPLKSGINQIAMIPISWAPTPTNPNGWRWAGFGQTFIESTAAPSAFTVTLTWNRGTSDVDLYVREPNGAAGTPYAGKIGDIVYYANREGFSTQNPYLDFDNTSGYGPEHYIARQGMVTRFNDYTQSNSINGTYRIGVHYYSWHGAYDAPRTIGWTVNWRFLGSCLSPCTDPETQGFWVTGSRSGSIADDDWYQDGPEGFNSGGSAWSPRWDVDYPVPQMIFEIPPSNTVMLP